MAAESSWAEYQRLVLAELERHSRVQGEAENQIQKLRLELELNKRETENIGSSVKSINKKLQTIEGNSLRPEQVREIIGSTLKDAETRGWSKRERIMGAVIFFTTIISFLLNIFALGPDRF